MSTENPVLSLFPASPNLSGSSFHRRKNPACRFQQAGFAIRYTRGRSNLATGMGEGTDQGPLYTSLLPQNRWKTRNTA